jgi:uncharacterized protein YbbK (DUF523 family)
MRKILVSTCLLGQRITGSRVRYNDGDVPCTDERFLRWHAEGRFVHICPEVVGGLSTPRPRARIIDDRVIAEDGSDVSAAYEWGAQAALSLVRKHDIRLAILKQDSPSCGSRFVFSEDFSRRVAGQGRTAALLRQHGVRVFGEDELDFVERELESESSGD